MADTTKATNPKDALGIKKVPMSTVPAAVVMEVGLGMLEGACKYGRHNYRIMGVRASVYYDAAHRHLMSWWEGENTDPDSGLSHIIKAIASLVVLRDSMIIGNWKDDRPPKLPEGWINQLNETATKIIAKYPDPKVPYTQGDWQADGHGAKPVTAAVPQIWLAGSIRRSGEIK
jgi:hypothetical protein